MLWGSPGHKRRLSIDALMGSSSWHRAPTARSVHECPPHCDSSPQPPWSTGRSPRLCLSKFPLPPLLGFFLRQLESLRVKAWHFTFRPLLVIFRFPFYSKILSKVPTHRTHERIQVVV